MKKLSVNKSKLNDIVHCTAKLSFIPGTINNVAYGTYAFDTLQIDDSICGKEIINAKELYGFLRQKYALKLNDERHYASKSSFF